MAALAGAQALPEAGLPLGSGVFASEGTPHAGSRLLGLRSTVVSESAASAMSPASPGVERAPSIASRRAPATVRSEIQPANG